MTLICYTYQSDENADFENVLHGVESLKELWSLVVAGVETTGIAVNHCWEDEIRCCSIATDTSEYVWNANKLLHFAIILRLDLFHWRPELNSLSTTNKLTTFTTQTWCWVLDTGIQLHQQLFKTIKGIYNINAVFQFSNISWQKKAFQETALKGIACLCFVTVSGIWKTLTALWHMKLRS